MKASEKHLADLYVLANNILENFYLQRDGNKEIFFYAFNNSLRFMMCDGSDTQQARLLQELADRGMLTYNEEPIADNLPEDFLSTNVVDNSVGRTFYLRIDDEGYNEKFAALEQYAPQPSITETLPLPKVISKITDQFSVHENNIISYEDNVIELEPQTRKIVALIMERSAGRQYTSLQIITDECLGEAYLEKVSSKDKAAASKYIRRCISDARGKFRIATHSPKAKDFFPNKHSVGYIFDP